MGRPSPTKPGLAPGLILANDTAFSVGRHMDFMQAAIGKFRTIAFGDLSPDEARRVKEAHDLLSNGWPGGYIDLEKAPESLKKRRDARQRIARELGSNEPDRQRKALQIKGLEEALAEEKIRNEKLRAMRYFDEIPTVELNLRTARKFCESDIEGRPDFREETESWRKEKFPGIDDDEVRKEASIIWRWSGILVSDLLVRYSSSKLDDAEVKAKILEEYQKHLVSLAEDAFACRLSNISKVATLPIPSRMRAYAEYMREPDVMTGLKDLWRTRSEQGLERKFGWIRRVEEKILIAPASR